MYQVTFSRQSNAVLGRLRQSTQMQLIDFLSGLTFEAKDLNRFGKIIRGSTTFYRIRWKQLRIYFEVVEENQLTVHYLLPKHTWNDFCFRSKLPFKEDAVEKNASFWKFLENLNE